MFLLVALFKVSYISHLIIWQASGEHVYSMRLENKIYVDKASEEELYSVGLTLQS